VLEALACGLPVITTRQNGAGELITEGEHGFVLSSPKAHGELIAALDHIAVDSRRHAMSAAAAKLGREQTFERHVSALVKVFREVAESKKSHSAHGALGGSRPNVSMLNRLRPAAEKKA
jgi:UDP-glucose:(heptosyl)LPS alpha-1,3-glucosyltransferase